MLIGKDWIDCVIGKLFGSEEIFVLSADAPEELKDKCFRWEERGFSKMVDSLGHCHAIKELLEGIFGNTEAVWDGYWQLMTDEELEYVVDTMMRFITKAIYDCKRVVHEGEFMFVEKEVM
ncbi:MAG: hypothetical protein ACTSPB_16615 [Candidatus Thorarchaeota archaeon]